MIAHLLISQYVFLFHCFYVLRHTLVILSEALLLAVLLLCMRADS